MVAPNLRNSDRDYFLIVSFLKGNRRQSVHCRFVSKTKSLRISELIMRDTPVHVKTKKQKWRKRRTAGPPWQFVFSLMSTFA